LQSRKKSDRKMPVSVRPGRFSATAGLLIFVERGPDDSNGWRQFVPTATAGCPDCGAPLFEIEGTVSGKTCTCEAKCPTCDETTDLVMRRIDGSKMEACSCEGPPMPGFERKADVARFKGMSRQEEDRLRRKEMQAR
jgi:hypothetical protein